MNHPLRGRSPVTILFGLALLTPAPSRAQAPATSSAAAATAAKDEAVVLSPFEVNSTEDKGYAASSALAGTRTNEKLANLPNSISVFTADLLSDLALNDFFGAVEFAVGAENIFNDQGNSYTWPRKTEPRQYVTTVTVDF